MAKDIWHAQSWKEKFFVPFARTGWQPASLSIPADKNDFDPTTFKKYNPEEYRPGIHITDDEELVQAGSEHTQTIFHPVGTCKMGNGDDSVVDEKLKYEKDGVNNRFVD